MINLNGMCPQCKQNTWHRNGPGSQLLQCLNCGGVFTAVEVFNFTVREDARKKTETKRKESNGKKESGDEEDGA